MFRRDYKLEHLAGAATLDKAKKVNG
jgi:hypothetical protein